MPHKNRSLTLLLAIILVLLPLTMGASSPTVPVSELERIARDYTVPSDFLWEVEGRGEITVDRLRAYAKEYKLPAQYLQRFLSDHFVFKMGSDFQYIPVNHNLAKNGYNWEYLSGNSWEKTYQSDDHTAVKVIDVSVHQGQIDWERVRADGVEYAFIRLGYTGYLTGKMELDARYHENMAGAQAAGVKVGVYYYSQAVNKWEAAQEAQLVLDNLRGYTLDLPVVFDVEGPPSRNARTSGLSQQRYTNIINGFMGPVEQAGYPVMLYSYSKFLIEQLDMTQLTRYPLWLAQYYQVPFFPYQFDIWQYSAQGSVWGVNRPVDMNLMFIKNPQAEQPDQVEGTPLAEEVQGAG